VGTRVTSQCELNDFLNHRHEEAGEEAGTFSFVLATDGTLLLASRRSEHVACSGGRPVLSAGEVTFAFDEGSWEVEAITNQSTGFCPGPESWSAVVGALDAIGIAHPAYWTSAYHFRFCRRCGELNVSLDSDPDLVCVFCNTDLPEL